MLFCVIVLAIVLEGNAGDLPSYFPRCKLNDEKLNDCILNAANDLKFHIRHGVKEIKLPAFDPLVISFTMQQDTDDVRANVSFKNFTVYGLDTYHFDKLEYDPETLTLRGSVRFAKVFVVTEYVVNALMYNNLPLIGRGNAEIDYHSVNGTFEINGKLTKRRGIKCYYPTTTKVRTNLINVHSVHLSGPELSGGVVNTNSPQIADTVTPIMEELVEGYLLNFIRTLTKLVPYHKIFPLS